MADLIIMPSLAFIAAQYTFLLFGCDNLANNTWRPPDPRHRLHHGHDVDLRRRHRAQRAHADGPAGHRARRARRCSASSRSSRRSATRRASSTRRSSWLTPTDFGGVSNLSRRVADRGLHLLGLGHRVERQRGVRRREHDARYRRRALDVHPRRDLRRRDVRGAVRCAAPTSSRTTPTTCSTPPARSCSARRRSERSRSSCSSSRCSRRRPRAARRRSCPAARTALSMAIHRAFPPKLGEVDATPSHAGVLDVALRHRVERLVFALLRLLGRYSRRRRAHVVGRRRRA